MDVGTEFLNEKEIRSEVKVVSGCPHRVGGDFVDADFSYGLESVDSVDRDKILMCLRKIELIGISKAKGVFGTCFLEARQKKDGQGVKRKIGITKNMDEHKILKTLFGSISDFFEERMFGVIYLLRGVYCIETAF